MWNPAAKVLSLLAFSLLAMYLGSFLYRFADPEAAEAQFPFWHAVRAVANPLEDDWEKNSLRTTSIAMAAIGMVVFALLVGMVTESVESAVRNADGDMARVIVSDHILVCGWSPHISQMLKDVSNVANKVKIVVLARPELKKRMVENLRDTLSNEERSRLRVFYRSGAPIAADDLNRVAASRASKIILLNSRDGDLIDADRRVLSRAMALRQNLPEFRGDIVAELSNKRDEEILKSIWEGTKARSVETVNSESLVSRFMAQAIRQPGLADVVASMMGENPASVFQVYKAADIAPSLVGGNLAELTPMSISGAVLCGVFTNDGDVKIGLRAEDMAGKVENDTELLVLGTGSREQRRGNEALSSGSPKAGGNASLSNFAPNMNEKGAESYLLCGWREEMLHMLLELDAILKPGSSITILDEDAPAAIEQKMKNLSVTCIQERADRFESLEKLLAKGAKPYDHVVLLGSALGTQEKNDEVFHLEEDVRTLASLVYVNDLLSKQKAYQVQKDRFRGTAVTVEFVNERVAGMVSGQANTTNTILPLNLGAKITAQTIRESRLNEVWKELLSQRGYEVYLRPTNMYPKLPAVPISFHDVANRIALDTSDVVIGYMERDGRAVINPTHGDREAVRAWGKESLIVLSEK